MQRALCLTLSHAAGHNQVQQLQLYKTRAIPRPGAIAAEGLP